MAVKSSNLDWTAITITVIMEDLNVNVGLALLMRTSCPIMGHRNWRLFGRVVCAPAAQAKHLGEKRFDHALDIKLLNLHHSFMHGTVRILSNRVTVRQLYVELQNDAHER